MVNVAESPAAAAIHPLDPLSEAEYRQVKAILEAEGRLGDHVVISYVALREPEKALALAGSAPREAFIAACDRQDGRSVRAIVSLTENRVVSWDHVSEGHIPVGMDSANAERILKADPRWQEAMRKRGITNFEHIQIDTWMPGNFGSAAEEGCRIVRCITYYRENERDNGYARPVEGVLAYVDLNRREITEFFDYGAVPLPPEQANYDPESAGPLRTGIKPLDIVQPEGPSFSVDGNFVRWQKWSFRVSMHPIDGLVLHTVGYEDQGRVRSILYRASLSEMVVPYGETSPMHAWKNAFDAGEAGLGRLANSLELGCDCLGTIHYFDSYLVDESANPHLLKNTICMHEEDYGILWKHYDRHSRSTEVRRSRRLVVSSIHTVGNYEYGFFWYFYQDGSLQMEIKLTGQLQTMAVPDGFDYAHSVPIAPNLAAPHHQHLFNFRLDFDIDGTENTVYQVDIVPDDEGDANPLGNAFHPVRTAITNEATSPREVSAESSRTWLIANPSVKNRLGQPVGYKLEPGSTPTMLARPWSSVAKRATFARHNLWVTQFDRDELHAAGDFPNGHPGGDGLPRYIAANRDLENQDVVLWFTTGVSHVARPEDWPVMPVEYHGFMLRPFGFFDRNPALDVPPSHAEHCEDAGDAHDHNGHHPNGHH